MILLTLNQKSGEPFYGQIVEQIKYKIACGQLRESDRIPSIRALARQLGINPRTVVKAYEELQHAGLVVMQHGRGVFVKSPSRATSSKARKRAIIKMARKVLSEASRMGAASGEVLTILKDEARKIKS